jgi:hypothetical protein
MGRGRGEGETGLSETFVEFQLATVLISQKVELLILYINRCYVFCKQLVYTSFYTISNKASRPEDCRSFFEEKYLLFDVMSDVSVLKKSLINNFLKSSLCINQVLGVNVAISWNVAPCSPYVNLRYIPEDSNIHKYRRENLKSSKFCV